MKLRKLLPLVGALCLGLTSSVFAHSNYQNGSESSTYGSSTSTDSSQTYQRGTFREITPNAGPRVAHGADVFITADFIWWKASEEGLDYAVTGVNSNPGNSSSTASKGSVSSNGEKWAPGFKVGLGLNLGHDGWDIYAQYTWLRACNSKSHKGDYVYVPKYIPLDFSPIIHGTDVSSKWDLHFNVIDLELGRNFYLSQFLTMRPHIGLKGTWQEHDLKSTTKGGIVTIFTTEGSNSITQIADTANLSKHTDVWGVGVRGGFNVAWYMSKCWSIYGDLALTTLWTNYYKLTNTFKVNNSATGNSSEWINLDNNNDYTCKYVAEIEIGLRWETWFYDDNYHFAIQAGWEQQSWINWSRFVETQGVVSNDFSVQGLNLKFRFDF